MHHAEQVQLLGGALAPFVGGLVLCDFCPQVEGFRRVFPMLTGFVVLQCRQFRGRWREKRRLRRASRPDRSVIQV